MADAASSGAEAGTLHRYDVTGCAAAGAARLPFHPWLGARPGGGARPRPGASAAAVGHLRHRGAGFPHRPWFDAGRGTGGGTIDRGAEAVACVRLLASGGLAGNVFALTLVA